ncbi:MAG: LacI family DNA-binding transcriptional regulator [Caulobacteraceae bacterium]|nr:LacI family DNA-binding transcriptional regulator [Caulobacteraceae bacterium]
MPDVTITHIARAAGVSIKTVSRVLNRETGVGAETRARVEAVIGQLGYRPNVSARSLAGARSYLIGLAFQKVATAYGLEFQFGAMAACRRAGYHLVVEQVGDEDDGAAAPLSRLFADIRVDGVILAPPAADDPAVLDDLEAAGLPYARVAPDGAFGRSPYAGMDDHRAAFEMTRLLWDHGHRRIAFIGGPDIHSSARRRREGWAAALAALGGEARPEWLERGMFLSHSGFEAADRLLDLAEPPTAIFAANDEMAFGALAAAAKRGLSVPRDLSVAGFDDTYGARSSWPPLTTVRQPVREMAEAAVDLLIAGFGAVASEDAPRAKLLEFALVERASVGPPPAR